MKSIAEGFIRNGIRALAFVSILAVSAGCASADTFWTLVNVNFDDGASATGYFTVDPTFSFLTDWDIKLSGTSYSVAYPSFEFTPGDSHYFSISPTDVTVGDFSVSQDFLTLIPSVAMTSAGGTITLATGSLDCYGSPCGNLVTGQITDPPPAPEPGTLSLMGAALAGIGLLSRKRAARP